MATLRSWVFVSMGNSTRHHGPARVRGVDGDSTARSRSPRPFQALGFRRIGCAITSSGKSSEYRCWGWIAIRDKRPPGRTDRQGVSNRYVPAGNPMRALGPLLRPRSARVFAPMGCVTGPPRPVPCPNCRCYIDGVTMPLLRCLRITGTPVGRFAPMPNGSARLIVKILALNQGQKRGEDGVRRRVGGPSYYGVTIGFYAFRPAIPSGLGKQVPSFIGGR